jgi:hypothetical protein
MLQLMKDKENSERLGRVFRRAYGRSQEPPPYFEEALREMEPLLEATPEEEVRAIVASARGRLFPAGSLGSVVFSRRGELDADRQELADAAGWTDEDLGNLEEDLLDLQTVAPDHLSRLVHSLRLRFDDVEAAVRATAEQHLVVRILPAGPILGRTRRKVTSFQRRSDLGRALGPINEEATRRAVDAYLKELKEALEETE